MENPEQEQVFVLNSSKKNFLTPSIKYDLELFKKDIFKYDILDYNSLDSNHDYLFFDANSFFYDYEKI